MTPVLWYQSGLVSDFYALTAGIDAYHRIEYPEAVTRPRLRDQADYLAPLHRPLAIPAAEPILFLSMVLLRFRDRHRLQVVCPVRREQRLGLLPCWLPVGLRWGRCHHRRR